jgi:hypothetical protein
MQGRIRPHKNKLSIDVSESQVDGLFKRSSYIHSDSLDRNNIQNVVQSARGSNLHK